MPNDFMTRDVIVLEVAHQYRPKAYATTRGALMDRAICSSTFDGDLNVWSEIEVWLADDLNAFRLIERDRLNYHLDNLPAHGMFNSDDTVRAAAKSVGWI